MMLLVQVLSENYQIILIFSSPVRKYGILLLTALVLALASHFRLLLQSFFSVMGKALSGELSSMQTGLAKLRYRLRSSLDQT